MKKILSLVLVTVLCLALFACGEDVCTNHVDTNPKDAKCDVCGAAVECAKHVDEDPADAECDVCGKKVECEEHIDEDPADAECDICGEYVECEEHIDEDPADTECDVCGEYVECEEHIDEDPKNAECDVCGEYIPCKTHVDKSPKNAKCDVCGKAVPCTLCVDADGNEKCDVCGKAVQVLKANEIADILAMYNAIAPSKVVTNSTMIFGEYEFSPVKSTLVVGSVDGATVAIYEYTKTSLREITDGSGIDIVGPFVTESHKMEYSQSKGLRVDGGKWDIMGSDFTPSVGANAFNFTEATVTDMVENKEDKTYSFVITKKNTEKVFGSKIDADVSVVITHSGADITGVVISYSVENSKNDDHPEINMTMSCSYSYETQEITLD